MAYRVLGDLIIPASNINDFSISGQSKGDILFYNGTNWVVLSTNTDGYVLTTHGAGVDPTWEATASGFTAGGDLSGTSTSQNVLQIHGASVPIAGSLTTGNILQVTGSSSLGYSPVNLAGGSNFVTGLLPFANLATITSVNSVTMPAGGSLVTGTVLRATGTGSAAYGALDLSNTNAITGTLPDGYQAAQTLAGDVTGTTATSTVEKVHGTTYPAGGSLITGTIPRVTGSSSVQYGALDLANSNAVTGALPSANQVAQTLLGDVTGTTAASSVVKLQNRNVNSIAPTDGYVLTWSQADGYWYPKMPGDFGSFNIATTGALNSGTLTATSLNSALLNIAGKSIYTGIPTTSTLSNSQEGIIYFDSTLNKFRVSQNGGAFADLVSGFTAGGDLSGTSTSQNVIALHSATTSINVGSATAPSSGQVLTATSSTAATWQTPSGGGGSSSPPTIDGYTVALWQQTETASATTWPNLATTGSIGTADLTASGVAPGNSSQFLPGQGGPFGYGNYTGIATNIGPSLTITYGIRGTGPSPSTSVTDWTVDCYYKPIHTAQATSSSAVIFGRRATTAATPTATTDWAFLLYQGAQHATGFQSWGYIVTFADGTTFRWSTAGGGAETIVAGGGAVAGTWALASNTWHHIGFKLLLSGGNVTYQSAYNGIIIAEGTAHTGSSTPKWLSASPEWCCLAGYNSATFGAPQGVVANCQLSATARPTSYFVDAAARIISQ